MHNLLIGIFGALCYTIFWIVLYVIWRNMHVKRDSFMDVFINAIRIVVLLVGFSEFAQSRYGYVAACTFLVLGIAFHLGIRAVLSRVDPLDGSHDANHQHDLTK